MNHFSLTGRRREKIPKRRVEQTSLLNVRIGLLSLFPQKSSPRITYAVSTTVVSTYTVTKLGGISESSLCHRKEKGKKKKIPNVSCVVELSYEIKFVFKVKVKSYAHCIGMNYYVNLLAVEKIKILGAILELSAKQHCQFSLLATKMGQMG